MPAWRPYAVFVPQLVLLTIIIAMRTATQCFFSHETAHARFRFYWYCGLIACAEGLFLYGITGFSFFAPWVPASWLAAVAALNPSRLDFVLGVMFWSMALLLVCIALDLLRQSREKT